MSLFLKSHSSRTVSESITAGFHWTPARVMLFTYLAAVLLGTVALCLPAANRGEPLSFINALFTATSAISVTGLVVVDSATHFTRFGQWILLALIQLGGLGILTFTTWIMMLAGHRHLGIFEQSTAVTSYGRLQGISWRVILRNVFLFSLLFEAIGTLLFYGRWRGDFTPGEAFFQSLFHSISAFCNAGFSVHEGGLSAYVGDGPINLTLIGLIVIGGLGFIVLSDLSRWMRHRGRIRLSLHSRVALKTSALLVVVAAVLLLLLEWHHSLAGLPLPSRLMGALFQAVTPRTAGFNTIGIADLTSPSLLIIMLLMLIGASPGSTGGGIKTTTFAILLALVRSQVSGRASVELMERRIPAADLARALAIVAMYGLTLVVGALLLLAAQGWGRSITAGHDDFQRVLFECVSALGTVGLSMDYTPQLTPVGRLIITAMMLIGRLGPISIVLSFAGRRHGGRYEYCEESVMTG